MRSKKSNVGRRSRCSFEATVQPSPISQGGQPSLVCVSQVCLQASFESNYNQASASLSSSTARLALPQLDWKPYPPCP